MKELIESAIGKGYVLHFKDCLTDKAGVLAIQIVELYMIQSWLRNTHSYHVESNIFYVSEEGMKGWMVKVYDIKDEEYPDLPYWNETQSFPNYESAMIFGVKTALEYIK